MPAVTCQYGNCLEDVGANGIVVSLKTPTFDEEKRAIYCCAAHAAAALSRLAVDRAEMNETLITNDDGSRVSGVWHFEVPRRWRHT